MNPERPSKKLIFSYGSNMFEKRLKERVPSATFYSIGYLCAYKLTWDKESADGSGKCNVEHTDNEGDFVWGVLYEIDRDEERDLDEAEGLGNGYDKKTVTVTPHKDDRDSNPLIVSIYYATEKDPTLRPYTWYKAFVVQGAREHELSNAYIEQLERVESIPDRNLERAQKNERLLRGA